MKKIYDSQKKFHGYKTQYDYYRTSKVAEDYFNERPFTVHDFINLKSMHVSSGLMFLEIERRKALKKLAS